VETWNAARAATPANVMPAIRIAGSTRKSVPGAEF
jgi:hypothetical protein